MKISKKLLAAILVILIWLVVFACTDGENFTEEYYWTTKGIYGFDSIYVVHTKYGRGGYAKSTLLVAKGDTCFIDEDTRMTIQILAQRQGREVMKQAFYFDYIIML